MYLFIFLRRGIRDMSVKSFLKRIHFVIYKAMWVSAVIKNRVQWNEKRLKKEKRFRPSEFRGRVGPDLQLSLKIPAQVDGWGPNW